MRVDEGTLRFALGLVGRLEEATRFLAGVIKIDDGSCFDGDEMAILEGPGTDGGRSTTITSGSESSSVRSMTLSSILSFAALAASRSAKAPEPQAFSSRALRSAACKGRKSIK